MRDNYKYLTTHARHDPAICQTAGLFRSIPKRKITNFQSFTLVYTFKKGFVNFDILKPLGAFDLRVFQGIVAMCGPDGYNLSCHPKTLEGKFLRKALGLETENESDLDNSDISVGWEKRDTLMIRFKPCRLLAEIAMADNGQNIGRLKSSLLTMGKIPIHVHCDGDEFTGQLMSCFIPKTEKKERWAVAVNPFMAAAILGSRPHIRINMEEVRSLRSDPGRLIHQRLCSFINIGESKWLTAKVLTTYVWPEGSVSPSTERTRMEIVRKALRELIFLGWTVKETGKDKYLIGRPPCKNRYNADKTRYNADKTRYITDATITEN